MSAELDSLIALGNDIIATKYYGVATTTILFYDYLLTLADEVEYFWSKKKSWTFWLFIANRYFPMTATVFFVLTMVVCTFVAQVALTARIYAVTFKNAAIAIGFAAVTVFQFALGIYVTALTITMGAQKFPPIPLGAYNLCVFSPHRTLEIVYTSVSLFYDSLAFSMIIFFTTRLSRKVRGLRVPPLLEIIAEDATWNRSNSFRARE
ncbi:hypothetical protein BJ322DRAFT_561740 [Thelephora terrestris]|uniref:DUF6533 domain-containing protein n=1 Tax=Thelephora terrestris TaxID=56493 RepID=A0A9P6L9W2_9AGAM|nr:hypothetical protein BJ322DRAFT_561740 [Thelephora terrestris]